MRSESKCDIRSMEDAPRQGNIGEKKTIAAQ